MTLIEYFGELKSSISHKPLKSSSNSSDGVSHRRGGRRRRGSSSGPQQPVELGTIAYVNVSTSNAMTAYKHGNYERTLEVAASSDSNKPIFANFIEYPGCAGVYEAGRTIFSHPDIVNAVEEAFVPAYFNTWDRHNDAYNQPMKEWGGELADSDWGYLRVITANGKEVVAASPIITDKTTVDEVAIFLIVALEALELPIPRSLRKYSN